MARVYEWAIDSICDYAYLCIRNRSSGTTALYMKRALCTTKFCVVFEHSFDDRYITNWMRDLTIFIIMKYICCGIDVYSAVKASAFK